MNLLITGVSKRPRKPIAQRFWEKVPERSPWPDECWQWRGGGAGEGYGMFRISTGKTERAHRVAWRLTGSEIPEGMELDHACRNRGCVRPEHLTLVEKHYNARQGVRAYAERKSAQTHCRNGHKYVEGSYAVTPDGWRACRACSSANTRRHYRKNAAKIIARAQVHYRANSEEIKAKARARYWSNKST